MCFKSARLDSISCVHALIAIEYMHNLTTGVSPLALARRVRHPLVAQPLPGTSIPLYICLFDLHMPLGQRVTSIQRLWADKFLDHTSSELSSPQAGADPKITNNRWRLRYITSIRDARRDTLTEEELVRFVWYVSWKIKERAFDPM